MDSIDIALQTAINQLTLDELARRAARAAARHTPRPVRPWCLCLRASDTRLDEVVFLNDGDRHAVANKLAHDIPLTSADIARLTKPVVIDWPGLDWTRAAARLGRHEESLRRWIVRGVFKLARYNARSCSKRGKPVPHIWSPTPLDPNADEARRPDPIWGSMWLRHHERVPPNLEFELRRLPRTRAYLPSGAGPESTKVRISSMSPSMPRFRGWHFICPGLPDEPPCGRVVQRLFLPIPPVTVVSFAEKSSPLRRLANQLPFPHPFAPACHHCHRIRYVSLACHNGWNLFIHHLSAGLLEGRDVAKPDDFGARRKRAPTRRRPCPAPARDLIHALLLTNLTTEQIAARLGIKRPTVWSHAKRIYRATNVHSRKELRGHHQQALHASSGLTAIQPVRPLPRQPA